MAQILDLDKLGVYATYEDKLHIIFVTYQGVLTGETARHYYRWLTQNFESTIQDVHGCVFDFREVTTIESSNTRTITQSSHSVHRSLDLKHVATALIAKDHYQEHILRITADMTPYPHNKRIVQSMGDALEFIMEWHALLSSKTP
jgi:hypothetical protein